jgi:hypothetical protein
MKYKLTESAKTKWEMALLIIITTAIAVGFILQGMRVM